MGSVWITGNVIRSTVGLEACWWLQGGNGAATPPGEIVIAGNTCAIDANRHGALVVGNVEGPDANFPRQNITYTGNLVTGLGNNDFNAVFTYTPAPPQAGRATSGIRPAAFSWSKEPLDDFAAWQKESGGDGGSRVCTPAFTAYDQGDLHLKAGRHLRPRPARRRQKRGGRRLPVKGPASSGRLRSWAGRLGLLLLSLLLALGLAEILCRQFVSFGSFRWVGEQNSSWNEPDEELDYRLTANWRGWVEAPEYRHRVEINSKHFRGPEPSAAPAVWMLGDSFVFGIGAELAESLPGQARKGAGEPR